MQWVLKNLTTGLIWLVTRVGGWAEAWGGGPWRAGKAGDGGGGTREQCGSNKSALVHFFRLPSKPNNWSDLAGDEGGGMGRRGEVAHGGRARGGDGGGAPESSVGARGEMGGAPESSVGATKNALVFLF